MTLILLPNLLGPVDEPALLLPVALPAVVDTLTGLFAESEKGAHRFLSLFGEKARNLPIYLVNEHTSLQEIESYLKLFSPPDQKWGLISDAGLPTLADPGSHLVLLAHRHKIKVEALSGPSSVTLALLLSGFNGNRFFFHGYLPIPIQERKKALLNLQSLAIKEKATQIFIETPYRNEEMLKTAISTLDEKLWLAVAWNLTLPTQGIQVAPLSDWKDFTLPLKKIPAVFLISMI